MAYREYLITENTNYDVATGSELISIVNALKLKTISFGNYVTITLTDDITLSSFVTWEFGDNDVRLILDGHSYTGTIALYNTNTKLNGWSYDNGQFGYIGGSGFTCNIYNRQQLTLATEIISTNANPSRCNAFINFYASIDGLDAGIFISGAANFYAVYFDFLGDFTLKAVDSNLFSFVNCKAIIRLYSNSGYTGILDNDAGYYGQKTAVNIQNSYVEIGENIEIHNYNYAVRARFNSYCEVSASIDDDNNYGIYAESGSYISNFYATGNGAHITNIAEDLLSGDNAFIYAGNNTIGAIDEDIEFEFATFAALNTLLESLKYTKVKAGSTITLSATNNISVTSTIDIYSLNHSGNLIIDFAGYDFTSNNHTCFNISDCKMNIEILGSTGKILSNKTASTYGIRIDYDSFVKITSLYIGENGNNNGFDYAIRADNCSKAIATSIIVEDNINGGFFASKGSYIYRNSCGGNNVNDANITIGTLSADGSFIY